MSRYDDILHLPHHQSATRPRMSSYDRAAQFSPFAALTGHGDAVLETARLVDQKSELSDDEKLAINAKLQLVLNQEGVLPTLSITYFIADTAKAGGAYITVEGSIKTLDEITRTLTLQDGKIIEIDDIFDITADFFPA